MCPNYQARGYQGLHIKQTSKPKQTFFEILSVCIVKMVCDVFIGVVFSVLCCEETTGNAEPLLQNPLDY